MASSSSADRSRQALEQFERLVELDPAHRDRRLDALRQDDPALAAQVRQLLQADGETGFEAPLELLATGPATSQPVAGQRLGPYELERLLGEGGMGTVWFARRAEGGFEQRVAIKFLRGPALGSKAEQRFLNEWEVLGRLRHPAIVDILDTGWTAAGTPYLVMDYVDGEPIDAYCHQHGLTLRQRVRLLVKVCRAVSHAHRNLVVHRDLKPANILVTSSGEPRLLDFGIAKRMTGDAEALALTAEGISPMTLGYASPEQLRGNAVTTVSDVYSLGVLLYELLTGRRPFRVPSASPFDLGQAILERDAGPPSAEPDLIVHGGVEAGALRRLLRGDLDKITLLALGRDPERRYRSVDALAADLERWLDGQPVEAQGDSLLYRWGKLVRRHAWAVGAVVTVFLALTVGATVATWKANEASEQRKLAEDHAERTELVNGFLVDLLAAPGGRWWRNLEHQGPETPVIDVLDEAAHRLDGELEGAPLQRATLHQTLNDTFLALGLPDRAEPQVRRALELRRAELGEVHPAVAESTYYLAATLRAQQRYNDALNVYGASFEIEEALPAPTGNYPDGLSEAALTAARLGRHDEDDGLLEKALEVAARQRPHLAGYLWALWAGTTAEGGQLGLAAQRLERARRWYEANDPESAPPRRVWHRFAAQVAWLGDDLPTALRQAQGAAESGALLRAQVLFDLGQWKASRQALREVQGTAAGSVEARLLGARIAWHLDGDAEQCVQAAEPVWQGEERRSQGPTWYLAEARSALATCLAARATGDGGARARRLRESAKVVLGELFEGQTPLHRRLEGAATPGSQSEPMAGFPEESAQSESPLR